MIKTCYGILNYNRPIPYNGIINKIPIQGQKDIILCTNNTEKLKDYENGKVNFKVINIESNVAKCKNAMLKYALENGYNYCFLIEDDIKIIENNVFNGYIYLLECYDYAVTMFGYGSENKNKVIGNKNNPAVIIKLENNKYIFSNRQPCSSFMVFKLTEDMVFFDERLEMLETEFLTKDLKKKGKIPFNGFFIDLPESWKYFMKTTDVTVRIKNNDLIKQDLQVRGGGISWDNNGDAFFEHIINKTVEAKLKLENIFIKIQPEQKENKTPVIKLFDDEIEEPKVIKLFDY